MQKEDGVYTCNGILFSHKNETMLSVATWMELEIITLSEISQTEKEISYDITYIWNLKKMIQMNLFTKQELTHRPRKQTMIIQGKGQERDELEA